MGDASEFAGHPVEELAEGTVAFLREGGLLVHDRREGHDCPGVLLGLCLGRLRSSYLLIVERPHNDLAPHEGPEEDPHQRDEQSSPRIEAGRHRQVQ